MKIAITGGAGFIGSILAQRLLDAGHEIVLLDLHKSALYPEHSEICDITDESVLTAKLKDVEAIYHLAAEHRDDVQPIQKYYDVNVGGAEAVVAAAKAHKIKKIIFTSTVAVYGLNKGASNEQDEPEPFNDYGRSKWEAEHIFETWAAGHKQKSLTIMRLVATFGPGNRGNIYNLMNQIAAGRFLMIGNGKNHKSIAYVENVAAFLEHCLTFGEGRHLYNYADKPDLNMNDMVRTIRESLGYSGIGLRLPHFAGKIAGQLCDIAAERTGRTLPISSIRIEKFCADTIVDAAKLNETGFKAPHDLADGLRVMMEHEFPTQKAA